MMNVDWAARALREKAMRPNQIGSLLTLKMLETRSK